MSLFTSFNAGVAGIKTAQSGLNTTAHNVGNTKTPGYTRQQNIQSDTYYQVFKDTDKATMQIGYGTTLAEIRQTRDIFLDREYRTEAGRLEFYDVQYTTAQEIENILGEMEGVEFDDALQKMWENIESLSTNPESITNRELFITQAEAFLEKANNAYQALRNYQINLNTQIEEQVTSVNRIADQIAELNLKIATKEASGAENANDYRDARNLLMDELSKYTYFEYREHYNGMVEIRMNNAPLVDDTNVHHLKCERLGLQKVDDNGNIIEDNTVETEMYNVVWASGGFGDVYDIDSAYTSANNSDVGSILGILTARGRKYGYYTDIPVRGDYNSDKQYEAAIKAFNDTTGNCLLEKIEAQFDLLIHKVVTAINDAFAPNVSISNGDVTDGTNAQATVTAKDGTVITLDGIQVLDASRCPVGADDDETIGTELFVRKAEDDGQRYNIYEVDGPLYIKDEDGNDIPITQRVEVTAADGTKSYAYKLYVYREENKKDVNTLYTVQNLELNQKVLENYSYLPVKANPAIGMSGAYDMDIYKDMLANWRRKDTMLDPNELAEYSAEGFYDALVGNLGTQGSVWKSIVTNQEKLRDSVEDKRQQVSGVSTDEELVSLLMYQHAYNAASRYITVIDEMLEHIIERLG